MYDLCVIGGGASGIAAAVTAARRGKSVIMLEKNKKLGRKLYATGNGRCNITNKRLDYEYNHEEHSAVLKECYNSSDEGYVDFLCRALGNTPYTDVMKFLEDAGIKTCDINGYVYPASLQASSFMWAIKDALDKYGVKTVLKTEIRDYFYEDGYFTVDAGNNQLKAKKLLIAGGGKSYASLGGTELSYELAFKAGHQTATPRPSLCGIITAEDTTEISGVRARATSSLYDGEGKLYKSEEGELQLTDYGLSGIMIFNLSSAAGRLIEQNKAPYICINLLAEYDETWLLKFLKGNEYRTILGNMNTLVNDRLASYVLKKNGTAAAALTKELSDTELRRIITGFKCVKFKVESLKDFENAQVCAGGVLLSELDYNFMSRRQEGLYFAGEIVDIDGICGGYNITFAVLSGIKVGNSI